ncbi:MAG: type VI secretion system baseplate subunit TssF [Pseudomonadota bacterium]
MDDVFLSYYEEELAHLRDLGQEFAAMHPNVARNLALDVVPCADPYVERLLEGVAYLAARTRLKVDSEAPRFARNILDFLYPDLSAPAPATAIVRLLPGAQVDKMPEGALLPRGTRLVSRLREGMATRMAFSTAHPVRLWPIEIAEVTYLQDAGMLREAGLPARETGAQSALRIRLRATDGRPLSTLALDEIDFHLLRRPLGPALFDALHGHSVGVLARPAGGDGRERLDRLPALGLPGLADDEAMLPRTRQGFEGYRHLREYFINLERFLFARVSGMAPTVQRSGAEGLDIFILLGRPRPQLIPVNAGALALFCTPVINLFERECGTVEVDRRRTRFLVQPDRTRSRDFEVYSLLSVEDQERDGPDAVVSPLFSFDAARTTGPVYALERRRRRPGEDERRRGRMRSSYPGDDVFIAVSDSPGPGAASGGLRRLSIRALCTNRDLAVFDERPELVVESGIFADAVQVIDAVRPPRPALSAVLPTEAHEGGPMEAVYWRLVAQLSLNHLALSGEEGVKALSTLLRLYADRGDQANAPHANALTGLESRSVVERLPLGGPMVFANGVAITLDLDEAAFTAAPTLMLGAILNAVLSRYAATNSFVRLTTRLAKSQESVTWPIRIGTERAI